MKHFGRWSPGILQVHLSAWELDELLHLAASEGLRSLRYREGRATRECLFRLAARTPAVEGDLEATATVCWHDLAWVLDHLLTKPLDEPPRHGLMRLVESWALPRQAWAHDVPPVPASVLLERLMEGIEPTPSMLAHLGEIRALERVVPTAEEREDRRRIEGPGHRPWAPRPWPLPADRDDLALLAEHLHGLSLVQPPLLAALAHLSLARDSEGQGDRVEVDWQHLGALVEHLTSLGCEPAAPRRALMRTLELWAVESPTLPAARPVLP